MSRQAAAQTDFFVSEGQTKGAGSSGSEKQLLEAHELRYAKRKAVHFKYSGYRVITGTGSVRLIGKDDASFLIPPDAVYYEDNSLPTIRDWSLLNDDR